MAAWTVPIEEVPQGDWTPVPAARYAWVRDSRQQKAVALLEKAPFIEMQPLEASALCRPEDGLETSSSLHAFLVRGASFGDPTFAAVRVSGAGRFLRVHQGSSHAEILGAYSGSLRKRPMVVLLEKVPEKLFPTAFTGGDAAFRGWIGPGTTYKWFRHFDSSP